MTAPTPPSPASAPPPQGSTVALIAILIAVSSINPIAINMFVPAMPAMRVDLETNFAAIQLVLSAYLFATAAGQLILGPLSDRLGRRPVLLGGLAVYIVASLACTLAPTIGILVLARILQGFGGCTGIVLGRAIVRDRYDRERAASMLGYITMGFAIAPMLGPVIGGTLNDLVGWRSIFALQTAFGVIVLVAAWLGLPETHPREPAGKGQSIWRGFLVIAKIPAFWAYSLTISFETAVFFAFLGGTPFIAVDMLGMSGTEYGLHFMFVPAGFIIGNFLTARYSTRVGIRPLIVTGCSIVVVAVIAMGIAFGVGWYHPLSLFVPMYAIGLGNGLTFANANAGAISIRPEFAGAASGFSGSLQIGLGGVATVAIGWLLGRYPSVLPLVAMMLAMAAAGLAAALWTWRARS